MTAPNNCDVLVIGSSPISLLIAVEAQRSGCSVTLAERSGELGGAWAGEEVDGQLVDRACHLLEPGSGARTWLFEQISLPPLHASHAPITVTPWGSIWQTNSLRSRTLELVMAGPAAVRHLVMATRRDESERQRVRAECRRDLSRLSHRVAHQMRNRRPAGLTFSPTPFAALTALAHREIEHVILSTTVDWIDSHGAGQVTASLNNGIHTFDHVVVSSGVDIDIRSFGETIPVQRYHFDNHHVMLEATPGPREFSYAALMTDPLIRRVVDIGPSPVPQRHRYLAHVRSANTDVRDIGDIMARLGLIDGNEPVHVIRNFEYTSTRTLLTGDAPDHVWVPDTYGDLSDNLHRLLQRQPDGTLSLPLPFASV